jgi:hypothetical protein
VINGLEAGAGEMSQELDFLRGFFGPQMCVIMAWLLGVDERWFSGIGCEAFGWEYM